MGFTHRRFCVSAFVAIAIIALCVAGVVAYSTISKKDSSKNSNSDFRDFAYLGTWNNDEDDFLIQFALGKSISVNLNSSTWWLRGEMVDLDLNSNPAKFKVQVYDSSFAAPEFYFFIYAIDECPQYMHLAYSTKSYPKKFEGDSNFILQKYVPRDINGLPSLHVINEHVFCEPLGCNGNNSAASLYLSTYSSSHIIPELVYDGCSSTYFTAAQTCFDFSLMNEIEDAPITTMTSNAAFSYRNSNTFERSKQVKLNHSYFILGDKNSVRYLMAVTVTKIDPDTKHVFINWAALSYSIHQLTVDTFSCDDFNFYNTTL